MQSPDEGYDTAHDDTLLESSLAMKRVVPSAARRTRELAADGVQKAPCRGPVPGGGFAEAHSVSFPEFWSILWIRI